MKTWKRWLSSAPLALATLGALAQGNAAQTRVAAASCAACHGTGGVSQGGILSLAGVDKAQLQHKLLAYKKGELPATVMHQHTKGYSDAELDQLADFFSRQKR
jgi:cytochrome c553